MNRRGFTLLEVLVVLVLIAMTATVSAIALSERRDAAGDPRTRLLDARNRAITTGRIVNGFVDSLGAFSALPNGIVLTDSAPTIRLAAADAK